MVQQRPTGSTARFEYRPGQEIFLYSAASRPALGPTQPPSQWVAGPLSPGVKRPGYQADRSPPYSAEVKNGGAIPPIHHVFMAQCLVS
jgi:hypothetical protein